MSNFINPFSLDSIRLPLSRIINREKQISFLNKRVIEKGENVLLTGSFGIGKTCLLKKFRGELGKEITKTTLIIEMEMRRLSADASDFLSKVLIKLVGVFWEHVLERPYSELIKAVTNPDDIRERLMPQVRSILELYRLLRPQSLAADLEKRKEIGLNKLIKAEKEEKVTRHVLRGDLTPSEFISLTTEILSALHEKGIKRIIIFGAEANHIDPEIEIELIRSNLEVFARENVQFILTAKAEILQQFPHLRDAFPAWLDLKPFESPKVLDEIIDVYSSIGKVPPITTRCRNFIWELSHGNPREIQRLCQECTDKAIARAMNGDNAIVDLDILLETISDNYIIQPK